jgi:carboxylesterase type B
VPSYAYRFDVTVNGIPSYLGATHFQEVAFVFNNTAGAGYDVDPFPNTTVSFEKLARLMSRSWVGFVTLGNPNCHGFRGVEEWPVFNATSGGGVGREFVFMVNGSSHAEVDGRRGEAIAFLSEHALDVYGR